MDSIYTGDSLHGGGSADHLVHGGVAVQIHRAVVLGSLHLAGQE